MHACVMLVTSDSAVSQSFEFLRHLDALLLEASMYLWLDPQLLVIEVQNLVRAVWDPDETVVERMVEDPIASEILILVTLVTLVWAFWKWTLLDYVAFSKEKESLYFYSVFVSTLVPLIPNWKTCLKMRKTVWLVQSFL